MYEDGLRVEGYFHVLLTILLAFSLVPGLGLESWFVRPRSFAVGVVLVVA